MKLVSFHVDTKKKGGSPKTEGGQQKPAPRRRKQRRRKNNRPLIVLSALLVVSLVVIALLVQHIVGSEWLQKEDAHLTYIDGIPVHEDFVEEGAAARTGEQRKIMYVVIHETDNVNAGADAQAHNSFIHSNGVDHELSWHYTVDDHEIWHHIPDDETAFHAGDRMEEKGGNKNGIGVEMCVNADGDYEQTLKNTQKLAATLLHEYGLSMNDLKKHQDFSGKNCPSTLLNAGRWDEFRQGVETELEKLERN